MPEQVRESGRGVRPWNEALEPWRAGAIGFGLCAMHFPTAFQVFYLMIVLPLLWRHRD